MVMQTASLLRKMADLGETWIESIEKQIESGLLLFVDSRQRNKHDWGNADASNETNPSR